MDSTRIDISDDKNLQNRVAAALRTMRELKKLQFIGTDSIRFYKTDTGDVYDWGGIPPVSTHTPYISTKILRVTAVAVRQNVLFADLIPEQRIDDPNNGRHTILDYINEIYANINYFNIEHYANAQMPGEENKQSWTVVLNGGDSLGLSRPLNNQYMKAYVIANDDVTISIQELN